MTLDDFRQTLDQKEPAADLSNALKALWIEANGDWDKAHKLVQNNSVDSCWVHAYLHRKEGDLSNAGHWYERAKRPVYDQSFEQEWQDITRALLE